MTRLSRSGHGVEPPLSLAGIGVIGIDKAADAILTAGNTKDDKVLHRQWRDREAVTFCVVDCFDVPHNISRLRVEGDHVGIECAKKNFVTENGEAAIDAAAAGTDVSR